MIAALMAYGVIATSLLFLAGMAVEWATPVRAIPRRFIWCGMILLSCGLTALAAGNLLEPGNTPDAPTTGSTPAGISEEAPIPARQSPSPLKAVQENIGRVMRAPIAAAADTGFDGRALLAAWGVLSASLMLIGVATVARNRRLLRSWPVMEMDGHRVRVSPATGPVVLGTLHPEIVVPRWLLSSSTEERRLALLHESEHLRARDGAMLAAAWAIVFVLPWNPALWWMMLRLRLGIEIDCDHRVLASGAERLSYGSMLIDVSGHPSGFSVVSPGLAGFPSNLERRLLAMTSRTTGHSRIRGGFGMALGATFLLVAFRAGLPTAAELAAMDATMVADRAGDRGIEPTSYYIDSKPATPEMAAALPSGTIASVDVMRERRNGSTESGSIRIYTRSPGAPDYEIDGRPATAAEFNALAAEEIESIVVRRDSNDPEEAFTANSGTVVVTTKAASSRGIASAGDGAPTTVPLVADLGDGGRVGVQASAAPAAGPIIEAEPDGYSLRFGVPADAAGEEPETGAIPLRNMGDPLFVIDDVISGAEAFNRLNPSSIESISVLKGAAASDFGGDPRARNGVILIRTKAQ